MGGNPKTVSLLLGANADPFVANNVGITNVKSEVRVTNCQGNSSMQIKHEKNTTNVVRMCTQFTQNQRKDCQSNGKMSVVFVFLSDGLYLLQMYLLQMFCSRVLQCHY